MAAALRGCFALAMLLRYTFSAPLTHHEVDGRPLAAVSELGQRLASHPRLQESADARLGLSSALEAADARLGLPPRPDSSDARLVLPSPQEIDAIKKVAQILVMLGEQVIPTIINDFVPPPAHAAAVPAEAEPGTLPLLPLLPARTDTGNL